MQISSTIFSDCLAELKCSPELKQVLRAMYLSGELDIITDILKTTDDSTIDSILKSITEEYNKHHNGNGYHKITLGDLQKKNSSVTKKLHDEISELSGTKKQKGRKDFTRKYGTISHRVVWELLQGHIKSLFKQKKDSQIEISFQEEQELRSKVESSTTRIISRIYKHWESINNDIDKNKLFDFYSKRKKLIKLLLKIYGETNIHAVIDDSIMEQEGLSFDTLRTWATLLFYWREIGTQVFFKEIEVFPYTYEIGVGRIDNISLSKINGSVPDKTDNSLIFPYTHKTILCENNPKSVGEIILICENIFTKKYKNAELEFLITDWKFAVGDGVEKNLNKPNIIKRDKVINEPIPEHLTQMKRYISSSIFSYFIESKKEISILREEWANRKFTIKGKIIYFFPDSMPVSHDVIMTDEEIHQAFTDIIMINYIPGKKRSEFKHVQNDILKAVINLANNPGGTKIVDAKQTEMFEDPLEKAQSHFEKIVRANYVPVYADIHCVIELVHYKDGKKGWILNVKRFNELVLDGKITHTKAHFECISKDHSERTPSMSVSHRKGIFKCHGCGLGGILDYEGAPADILEQASFSSNLKFRFNKNSQRPIFPKRGQEVIAICQKLLQENLRVKPEARDYLGIDRKIDPDFALTKGIGFGDIDLIKNLIDCGVTYNEMVLYSLLILSPKNYINTRLIGVITGGNIMKNTTKEIPEILRVAREEFIDLKPNLQGNPRLALDEHITFPLDIEGIVTSFYGRAIHVYNYLTHTKVITQGYDQGIYNMTNCLNSDDDYIVDSEGGMDTLTFMQHSNAPNALAECGSKNDSVILKLSETKKRLIIAGDWDEISQTGQKMTLKKIEELRKNKFTGEIYNFTKGYVANLPEGRTYKDTNRYWVDYEEEIEVFNSMEKIP